MTNEEAIYELRNTAFLASSLAPIDEAIEMACEALSRPERKGKWITPQREGCQTWDKKAYAQCSICGAKEYLGWSKCFCPNCGADMRGEDYEID